MVLAPSESSSIFPPDDDGVPYYFKLDGDYDNFAAYEAAGKQRRLWIANEPNQPPCFVNPSTHTIQSLANAGYNFFVTIEDPPVEYFGNQFEELQIPLNHTANAPLFSRAGIHGPSVGTMVHVGPGVLVISLLNRDGVYSTEAKPIPHTSSLMQASYQNFHHIDTLRHVFLWAVTNQDTFAFLHRFLYTAEHGLRWPSEEPRSFEYGSPEFDGLLGTRLGKLICYLVLEAWPRGTRRITRVVTYSGPTGSEGFMRFDIEPVV
ncbi:hypothetical protein N7478_009743 [Penicillium angulare]|uniref:uncharacterized protein n=1 Tax=Penicillium angulare TaxID=116970 RepID=UPI002541F0BE|nr:uncharacterized protein N7478_009743 [Penicillium angulare]KAJ5266935.1 hypothetical protein N7478_009743 [Penicillium angulare]